MSSFPASYISPGSCCAVSKQVYATKRAQHSSNLLQQQEYLLTTVNLDEALSSPATFLAVQVYVPLWLSFTSLKVKVLFLSISYSPPVRMTTPFLLQVILGLGRPSAWHVIDIFLPGVVLTLSEIVTFLDGSFPTRIFLLTLGTTMNGFRGA